MYEDRIALYIRLSSADEDTGRKKDESNSIVNQRSLIHSFLDKSEELSDIPRREFVDDGYSGTNTNRPAFQEMIRLIRDGQFNICISKDFSRMCRDYLEMGDYLECLFPFLHVRYISINDNYDSNNYKGTTGGLDVVMRNLVYDAYSRDLSYKVKTGKIQTAKKGRRTNGYPAFGYMKDPEHKGIDIIDPDAAWIVRKIFDATIQGMPLAKIADMLNEDGIPTPGQYFVMKHPGTKMFGNSSVKQAWNYMAVERLVNKYSYTGASVSMYTGAAAPCQKKRVKKPKDEWIIVPGIHEAIVTEEEFERAQQAIKRRPSGIRKNHKYPLRSLLVCSSCGRKLARAERKNHRSFRFYCKYGRDYDNSECRSIRIKNEEELNRIVYRAIMDLIVTVDKKKKAEGKKQYVSGNSKQRDDIEQKIDALKNEILKQYEEYAEDRIDKNEFFFRKTAIGERIRELEQDRLSFESKEPLIVHTELEANCRTFKDAKNLTYDMSHAFIDRIIVCPDNQIEIRWKFQDLYKDLFVENKVKSD